MTKLFFYFFSTLGLLSACAMEPLLSKEPSHSSPTHSQSISQKISPLPNEGKQRLPARENVDQKVSNKGQAKIPPSSSYSYGKILKKALKNKLNSQQTPLKKNTASKTQIDFRKQAQVLLGDGRSLSGSIKLRVPPQIRIEHSKGGINYYKDIQMEDVDSIEFKAWEGKYLKRKKQGEVYRFEVSRYVIHLNSGQSLIHRGELLPFLQDFNLSNENGKVQLYSYWLDLYKKEKTWHTGLQGALGKERLLCHNAVVKKISFTRKP